MVLIGDFSGLEITQLFCYFVMIYASTLFILLYLKNRNSFFDTTEISKFPSVTIIVPAFNEEKHIKKCLQTCLNLNYPKDKLKVICVNDGSTDRTLAECRKIKDKRLTVLSKKNTGKADSMNYALPRVKTEYVCSMDADSFPTKDFLKLGMGEFKNPKVVAVSPALKINTANTIIQKIQWMEYSFSIYLRKLFAFFDCQYVLPGPGSIYKTDILKKLGGWDKTSIVEDTELAFRLQREGFKIENCSTAYVYTECPSTFKGLFAQRIRWYRGYLHTTLQYFSMVGNSNYGNLGVYILPINFLWYFIIGFMFFLPLYLISKGIYNFLYTVAIIGFQMPELSLGLDILSFGLFHYFILIFALTGISVMFFSLHSSAEEIKLRERKGTYLSYFLIYPVLYAIFWMSAIAYEIFKVNKKW